MTLDPDPLWYAEPDLETVRQMSTRTPSLSFWRGVVVGFVACLVLTAVWR